MQLGNKWSWTWIMLAILVAFQTLTSLGVSSLLDTVAPDMSRIERKLASLPVIMWCFVVGYGVPLVVAILLCCFRRFAAIIGYCTAALLSLPVIFINMIAALAISEIIPVTPMSLPFAALVLPLALFVFGVCQRPRSGSDSVPAEPSNLSPGSPAEAEGWRWKTRAFR